MTGQGHATEQGELGTVLVELRTVNSRGFKCVPRISDSLSSVESKIEALVRSRIHRGTVHVSVMLRRAPGEELPNINSFALKAYLRELRQFRDQEAAEGEIDLSLLLTLPGVLSSNKENRSDDRTLWGFVEATIVKAIDNLDQMRAIEGHRMVETLSQD